VTKRVRGEQLQYDKKCESHGDEGERGQLCIASLGGKFVEKKRGNELGKDSNAGMPSAKKNV